ncbi:hypothetical protein Pelo_18482 [Pelomyxa schiedti]|nr:hypothetical protein Pelo_18482 [Pelomyxa schiedti]
MPRMLDTRSKHQLSGQCKAAPPPFSVQFVNNSCISGKCPTPGQVNFIVFPPTEDAPPSAVFLPKLGCIQKWVLEHSFEGSQETDSNGRFSLSVSGFNSSHFNSRRTISTVEVSCGGLNKQVLVQVQRDEERVEEICVTRESQRRLSVKPRLESLPSNVLVVFLDAIGRNSFMRNFPKTVALLDEPNLKTTEKDDDDYHLAFQFFRYHAVAPNTFLNARAMFTGQFDTGGTSLWKRFHDSGHVTALIDNSCWDWFYFYLRKELNQSNDRDVAGTGPFSMKERCIDGKSTHTLAFEYTTKFWETYSDVPKFAVTMLIEGHENTGHVAALMDQELANLISGKTLNLSDTAVFIVADHGLHMGPLFALGLESADLENKLPVLSNEQALITAFDIHSTLSDFSLPEQEDSHPPNRPSTSPTQVSAPQHSSLFRHIPASRTCATAGIPQQFCKCVSQ